VATSSVPPVVLRNGVTIGDPLGVLLQLVEARWQLDLSDASRPAAFGESDLRRANRYGARISAAQISEILGRRRAIERALRSIPSDASLAGRTGSVPWLPMEQLFEAFAGIRGVGFSKMTKALHPKRPALIPMLDSVVQKYLEGDDPGTQTPFGPRALALVRGYKRDLDRNGSAVRKIRRELVGVAGLVGRGCEVSEVRILDLLIVSAPSAG
jgi:hypothetical protein